MLAAGTRERWLAALLVVVLAAPIVGITLYFFNSAQQRIAFAHNEREGVTEIAGLERFLAAEVAYGSAIACDSPAVTVVRKRNDADRALHDVETLAMESSKPPTMSAIHAAWQEVRQSTDPHTDFSALSDALDTAFVNLSDDSGLTFEPQVEGLDLGDSLAYRLPRAIDLFAATQRTLCSSRTITLDDRFQIAMANAQGNDRALDAFQDIDDAVQRGDPTKLLAVSRAYASTRSQLDAATRSVHAYANHGADGRNPAVSALGRVITSLEGLMTTEVPAITAMVDAHTVSLETERILDLVPGIVGVLGVIVVVLLLRRVLYARARIRAVEQAAAEHERMAMHDSLTGLLNRRAFLAAIENAATEGSSPGVLCLIDLDDFKKINDSYGHLTGDDVLRRVSRIVEGAIRSTDAAARIGGDEFALFLRSPIDRQGVTRVVNAIASDVRSEVTIRGHAIASSASIGAATIAGRTTEAIDEAFALADAALYEAKRHHRGGWEFADPLGA